MSTAQTSQMDDGSRAVCFAMRCPGKGLKPMKLKDIRLRVFKKDGKTHPSIQAVQQAVASFKAVKKTRGRKKGTQATTKEDDKAILRKFHLLRPPGAGIDSNILHSKLPKTLRIKVGRRTIIRRLAKAGYVPQKKLSKSDPSEKVRKKRLAFCRKYKGWSQKKWVDHLEAIGDIKEFTWYPKSLQPRFRRLRASWTYMNSKERKKAKFQRPKRWFAKEEWKKVRKQKVFGFTASNGKQLTFLLPSPWNQDVWAGLVKKKLAPWLKKVFPHKNSYNILLDGEKVFRAAPAKAALKAAGISVLPSWPPNSPDLNPQENVWSRGEPSLRKLETGQDSFEKWQKKLIPAVEMYSAPEKLVPSMADRIKQCLARDGNAVDW